MIFHQFEQSSKISKLLIREFFEKWKNSKLKKEIKKEEKQIICTDNKHEKLCKSLLKLKNYKLNQSFIILCLANQSFR